MKNRPKLKPSQYNKKCDVIYGKVHKKKCTQKTVKCPKCGQLGHPNVYKADEHTVIPVVVHTHFTKDKDVYRNLFCGFDNKKVARIDAPELAIPTWKIVRDINRYRFMPRNVRQNLGWDRDE